MFTNFKPIPAKEIRTELNNLIERAKSESPFMVERLENLKRWIKDKKDGLLDAKKYVKDFLIELIKDTELLLDFETLSEEDKEIFIQQLSSLEKLWYKKLLPKWLVTKDEKLEKWKREMMAENFKQEDETFLKQFISEIKKQGGEVFRRYILDLTMATDLLINSDSGTPLAVQITTQSQNWTEQKQENWKNTLQQWGIERGVFFCYNPQKSIDKAVQLLLKHSYFLPTPCYYWDKM